MRLASRTPRPLLESHTMSGRGGLGAMLHGVIQSHSRRCVRSHAAAGVSRCASPARLTEVWSCSRSGTSQQHPFRRVRLACRLPFSSVDAVLVSGQWTHEIAFPLPCSSRSSATLPSRSPYEGRFTTTSAVKGSSLAPFPKTPQLPRGIVPPRKLVEGAVSAGVGEERTSRAEEGARYGDLGVECPNWSDHRPDPRACTCGKTKGMALSTCWVTGKNVMKSSPLGNGSFAPCPAMFRTMASALMLHCGGFGHCHECQTGSEGSS
eukprot:scaffold128682_cov63-Phaeocystis_antarctica.AAC.2